MSYREEAATDVRDWDIVACFVDAGDTGIGLRLVWFIREPRMSAGTRYYLPVVCRSSPIISSIGGFELDLERVCQLKEGDEVRTKSNSLYRLTGERGSIWHGWEDVSVMRPNSWFMRCGRYLPPSNRLGPRPWDKWRAIVGRAIGRRRLGPGGS